MAIARDGELLWADGLGWADRESKRAATAETPYRIASITKTMTAVVVVGLAHEGRIDLDAPVACVLPDGILRSRTVGGNGVVSTAPDLARWADALGGGELVPADVRDDLWSPVVTPAGDTLPYGLGWWVEETPALRLVSHGGQWPSYSGLLLHLPGPDLTLAILANSQSVSRPFYKMGTGTSLYSTFAAAFLRRFALRDLWEGEPPELPRDASVDSLTRVVKAYRTEAARLHLGAELFGRGLVAKAAGDTARADSLMRATAECCRAALRASEDLGLLFHLGRSGDPVLREIGRGAPPPGERPRRRPGRGGTLRSGAGSPPGAERDIERPRPATAQAGAHQFPRSPARSIARWSRSSAFCQFRCTTFSARSGSPVRIASIISSCSSRERSSEYCWFTT